MLESQQQGEEHGHLVVEAEEGRRLVRLLHERQVGTKEEGIVVVADEALPSEECLLHDLQPVTKGPPGSLLRGDL